MIYRVLVSLMPDIKDWQGWLYFNNYSWPYPGLDLKTVFCKAELSLENPIRAVILRRTGEWLQHHPTVPTVPTSNPCQEKPLSLMGVNDASLVPGRTEGATEAGSPFAELRSLHSLTTLTKEIALFPVSSVCGTFSEPPDEFLGLHKNKEFPRQ